VERSAVRPGLLQSVSTGRVILLKFSGLNHPWTADLSTTLRSLEKHFQETTAKPQISPPRCAPVEMTKGRAALPETVVAEQDPFFIALGGPKAHDSSVEKHSHGRAADTADLSTTLLRSSGEMTKGRAALPLSGAAEQEPFSSAWVGRRPMTSPGEMTKGRVVLPGIVVAEKEPFFRG
jgi:hypothetical protein